MIFVRVRKIKKSLQMIIVAAVEAAAVLTNFLTGLKLVSKVNYYGA
jgi:hypothetical protein